MKRRSVMCGMGMALALAIPARAEGIETRGAHCNDAPFASDGGGISACLEYAVRYHEHILGIGLFGATPEFRSNAKGIDPLNELARLNMWYGHEFEGDGFDYVLTGRVGIEGGAADDLAEELRNVLHDLFGQGKKNLVSTKDTTLIGGVSGFIRSDYEMSTSGSWGAHLNPYGHAALGNDTIELGAGVMLALQPADETEAMALVLPKQGAYAPTFGGDGIALFAGVRGVARETLYDDLANPFIAEAGVAAQATLWDFAVVGASASCTTKPYDGSDRADCKANLQMGALF